MKLSSKINSFRPKRDIPFGRKLEIDIKVVNKLWHIKLLINV